MLNLIFFLYFPVRLAVPFTLTDQENSLSAFSVLLNDYISKFLQIKRDSHFHLFQRICSSDSIWTRDCIAEHKWRNLTRKVELELEESCPWLNSSGEEQWISMISSRWAQILCKLLSWCENFMHIKKHHMADLKLIAECFSAIFTEKLSSPGTGCPRQWWNPHLGAGV